MVIRYETVAPQAPASILPPRKARKAKKKPARVQAPVAPAPAITEDASGTLITPGQISAARTLLGWSQAQLAVAAEISRATMMRIEAGATDTKASSLRAIEATLVGAGIEIVHAGDGKGEGVRFALPLAIRPYVAPPIVPEKGTKAAKPRRAKARAKT